MRASQLGSTEASQLEEHYWPLQQKELQKELDATANRIKVSNSRLSRNVLYFALQLGGKIL